ncbi:MAG: electron transport complex subunit RsxC [Oscillospiraceae bacterium]|nr:electron transport complex subunit RsxC [Oscillospiraceae bacterium]MBR2635985.1 electron transport complex subunit RsxC [Oscillospiraceae bacterium]
MDRRKSKLKMNLNGVKVPHHKNTMNCETVSMPVPATVTIPLLQHMGAPCTPVVKLKDEVKVGQLLAQAGPGLSVPIHSSVSGTVVRIEDFINPGGVRTQSIVINTDGLQTVDESVKPPVVEDHASFVEAVRNSGLVGLGGAGFPTFIKLNPKNLEEVDTLVINGAECEPYITADNREFLENGKNVVKGIELVCRYLAIDHVFIGIEDNKPEAIAKMKELIKDRFGWKVVALKSKYPQGAEKVLIYETTGKVVKEGQLPADQGVIVMNVSSVAFVASYIETGMPLVSKRLTVDGSAVAEPKNVLAPIGAHYGDVIEFCGGYKAEPKMILMGGPMMGIAVPNDDYPVVKNNNAILAFAEEDTLLRDENPCIRCSRCVNACPVLLMPAAIDKAVLARDLDTLAELKVNLCIECGCCSYVCPAGRYLTLRNKMAKKMLREKK